MDMTKLLVKGLMPPVVPAAGGVSLARRQRAEFRLSAQSSEKRKSAEGSFLDRGDTDSCREVTIHGDFAFESCPIAKVYAPGKTRFRDGEAMFETLVVVGLIVVAIGFPWLMIHGLIQMWRDKSRTGIVSSGVAGTLSELDRVVRPSIEHVLETKNSVKMPEDDIGGN